ncbi:hypothetical protein C8R44DRAFT_880072 [Mycena epipterygia]|nr:hypothetical protein C8R44DRAFT_880072 [Mycena epipterygia]
MSLKSSLIPIPRSFVTSCSFTAPATPIPNTFQTTNNLGNSNSDDERKFAALTIRLTCSTPTFNQSNKFSHFASGHHPSVMQLGQGISSLTGYKTSPAKDATIPTPGSSGSFGRKPSRFRLRMRSSKSSPCSLDGSSSMGQSSRSSSPGTPLLAEKTLSLLLPLFSPCTSPINEYYQISRPRFKIRRKPVPEYIPASSLSSDEDSDLEELNALQNVGPNVFIAYNDDSLFAVATAFTHIIHIAPTDTSPDRLLNLSIFNSDSHGYLDSRLTALPVRGNPRTQSMAEHLYNCSPTSWVTEGPSPGDSLPRRRVTMAAMHESSASPLPPLLTLSASNGCSVVSIPSALHGASPNPCSITDTVGTDILHTPRSDITFNPETGVHTLHLPIPPPAAQSGIDAASIGELSSIDESHRDILFTSSLADMAHNSFKIPRKPVPGCTSDVESDVASPFSSVDDPSAQPRDFAESALLYVDLLATQEFLAASGRIVSLRELGYFLINACASPDADPDAPLPLLGLQATHIAMAHAFLRPHPFAASMRRRVLVMVPRGQLALKGLALAACYVADVEGCGVQGVLRRFEGSVGMVAKSWRGLLGADGVVAMYLEELLLAAEEG